MSLPDCVADTPVESRSPSSPSIILNSELEDLVAEQMMYRTTNMSLFTIPEEPEPEEEPQATPSSASPEPSIVDEENWPLPRGESSVYGAWSPSQSSTLVDSGSSRASSITDPSTSSSLPLTTSQELLSPITASERSPTAMLTVREAHPSPASPSIYTNLASLMRYTHAVDLDRDDSISTKVTTLVARLEANNSIVYLDAAPRSATFTTAERSQTCFLPVLTTRGLATPLDFIAMLRAAAEAGDIVVADSTPHGLESGRSFWMQVRGYFPYPEMEFFVEAARRHVELMNDMLEAGVLELVDRSAR